MRGHPPLSLVNICVVVREKEEEKEQMINLFWACQIKTIAIQFQRDTQHTHTHTHTEVLYDVCFKLQNKTKNIRNCYII